MISTRGKKIEFDLDFSEDELNRERDDGAPAKPSPKRRRAKQLKAIKDDPGFNPGSSSGKGKEKTTYQNQLITRRNGRGGKLQDLMNMPVDIFTEVGSYLSPYDLRRLALTSKRLRDILMTKEARHIWKTAIASVPDLPECPTDLNEPQYVFLLYSSECYTVGCTSRGTKVDWFHRVRFCAACQAEKMTHDPDRSFRNSTQGLGLDQATLSQIMHYFNSSRVMLSAKGYGRAPPYYIEAIKKAVREYETLPQERAADYLSRLNDMRQYHLITGWAMLKWKDSQIASRADDIAAEKNARFECIKVKLLDLGWDEKDFPTWEKEFKDLVFKNQKLTPKVWQNIRPKLESLLETCRNNRLERERRQRRFRRETAIREFYEKLGVETLKLPLVYRHYACLLPELDEVHAPPSIKSLLTNDTETVTEDQWIEVAPEARLFILGWWRDILKRVAARLEDGATTSVAKTGTSFNATDSKAEKVDAISDLIEGLRVKLSYARSAFVCKGEHCGKVFWFPYIISHALSDHRYRYMDLIIDILQPLRSDGQALVKRLLKDLMLDPDSETATLDGLIEDRSEKNLLCTRCDERVATYMTFNQMIDHFLGAQRWFDNATEAVRRSPDSCYPSRTVNSQLPKIVNDHDWVSRDTLLVRQDDQKTKGAVLKLQSDFRKEGLHDPLCNVKGIGGEDLEREPWRKMKRSCLLCPESYGPYPCWPAEIALHIRQKHDKEPDLEKDTASGGSYYSSNPCPL